MHGVSIESSTFVRIPDSEEYPPEFLLLPDLSRSPDPHKYCFHTFVQFSDLSQEAGTSSAARAI